MIRYAPMEKYTHGLVPSKGMLRYRADAECDLDHALRLDMTDEEYVITVLMEGNLNPICNHPDCIDPTNPHISHGDH